MEPTRNNLISEERRKLRIRSWLINGMAIIGAIGVLSLLGFSRIHQSKTPIQSLEVQVESSTEEIFLDTSAIRQIVMKAGHGLIGKKVGEIDLQAVHQALVAHPTIRNSQVFTTVDGRCVVKVRERRPIARILNSDGSGFYLDHEGFAMPLSRLYTAHVPVFTGRLTESQPALPVHVMARDSIWASKSHLDEIYNFTLFLRSNNFMAAQVEHVFVNDKGDLEIVPRVGNHRIVFGDAENLETKYRKLMTFYANTLHNRDLNQYRRINLKYHNQVVCEKY